MPVVTARWVESAPLARPVEPEVKRIVAKSSGAISGSSPSPPRVEDRRQRLVDRPFDRQDDVREGEAARLEPLRPRRIAR